MDQRITQLNRTDYRRTLAQHARTGELYIVEYCALWADDKRIGTEITASIGPVSQRDLGINGPVEPTAELLDLIDTAVNLSDEDAAWLDDEDQAGRLSYPIGTR